MKNKKTDSKEILDKSPDNYNFVQVSRTYLREMGQLARKSPVAQEILLYLVEHMGKTTNAVVCSYGTLQEITNLSRTTVANAIKTLKKDGWIETVKIGNATAYCVNERAFWQAGRNQRKYAIFSATVIASASEQTASYHDSSKNKLMHIPFLGANDVLVTNENEQLDPPDQMDLTLN